MEHNLLPADTFIVKNNTVLHENRRILISLYQPLIGSTAISLYYTLWTYLDYFEYLSDEIAHNTLFNNMMISINEFIDARRKLESIGLLKTYVKEDKITNYIYEIYSPQTADEFLNNPVFAVSLENALGKREYKKTVDFFKVPAVKLKGYEDITASFTDNFTFDSKNIREVEIDNIRRKNIGNIKIIPNIDLNTVLSLIPDELLNKRTVNAKQKDLIIKLALIYNFNDEEMISIIRNSINEKKEIDVNKLKQNANKDYEFDNSGKLPSLIYKTQPDNLKSTNEIVNKQNKMIKTFETTSPYDFIASKYNTGKPTSSDLKIISYLLIDLELKPGVVNVLVDYVLKINNNKLTKGFVEVIAAQWKKEGIETVLDAMNLAKREYEIRNKVNSKGKVTSNKITPKWINEEIKADIATEEEIKEFEKMLGEIK